MKKSLIALAALAAAGAASAQSGNLNGIPAVGSVQLFGIVDATWAHGSASGAGSASKTQLTNSGYNSSRLGFRGTEDLGGGLSASFWLEMGVNNDDGTGQASNVNNQASGGAAANQNGSQGLTFNRQSWVSLNGGWGSVRLGRDYTPQFVSLTSYDPFGTNGVGTNQMLNGVSALVTTAVGPYAVGNSVALPGSQYATRVRASNSVAYLTPSNLGGFNGTVQYYLGENASNATAGTNPAGTTKKDGTGWGVRGGYAAGPLDVGVAFSNTNYALLGDIKTYNLGGSYDFGVAKVMAQYQRDRVGGSTLVGGIGAGTTTGKSWLLGGTVPVGVGLIRVSYSQYRLDLPNATYATDPTAKKWALGYVHNLSKRTALYATYARLSNSGGANGTLNGAVSGTGVINNTSTGYDIGLRHAF